MRLHHDFCRIRTFCLLRVEATDPVYIPIRKHLLWRFSLPCSSQNVRRNRAGRFDCCHGVSMLQNRNWLLWIVSCMWLLQNTDILSFACRSNRPCVYIPGRFDCCRGVSMLQNKQWQICIVTSAERTFCCGSSSGATRQWTRLYKNASNYGITDPTNDTTLLEGSSPTLESLTSQMTTLVGKSSLMTRRCRSSFLSRNVRLDPAVKHSFQNF